MSGPEKYALIFAVGSENKQVCFPNEGSFLRALELVLKSKVPIAGGGMILGASEKIGFLSLEGKITNKFISISWRGPGEWEVREPGD